MVISQRPANERAKVQSVLIARSVPLSQAIKLLRSLGYVYKKVHTTKNWHRFRQFNPHPSDTYITLREKKNVMIVVKTN